ncbi:MAG: hypothetical protein P4N60_18290 [Verrucomicrobiae bacterium]|nr:hypothetical protein [Verrucomicrobiae bacterium]
MQIKKAISDWANKWFFVKEKKPGLVIALVAVAVGLAAGITVDLSGRSDDNFWARQAAKGLGLIVGLVISLTLWLAISGAYNLYKRFANKK